MKKMNITISLEMSVPDDWELSTTSEGTQVLKLPNNQFMDIAIEPLFASDPEETWSSTDNDDTLNDILDMIESESVTYEFITHYAEHPHCLALLRPAIGVIESRLLFERGV